MDPVTALGVAGAVIQFVDFGTKWVSKVVSKSGEIYNAMQEGYAEDRFASIDKILERDANEISIITARIQRPLRLNASTVTESKEEKDLAKLCQECTGIAEEIIDHLNGLKITAHQIKNDEKKKWGSGVGQRIKSLGKAIKAVWTEDKLSNMSERFAMVKRSLEMNVLVSIR